MLTFNRNNRYNQPTKLGASIELANAPHANGTTGSVPQQGSASAALVSAFAASAAPAAEERDSAEDRPLMSSAAPSTPRRAHGAPGTPRTPRGGRGGGAFSTPEGGASGKDASSAETAYGAVKPRIDIEVTIDGSLGLVILLHDESHDGFTIIFSTHYYVHT